nr:MAG TPA: hypothetical protein [Caudoviricetes sp.]
MDSFHSIGAMNQVYHMKTKNERSYHDKIQK